MKAIPYRNHLILPFDNRVAVMVPHVKTFVDPETQQQMMLVPHQIDETQVLRNLGYDVRPPVMMSYEWPGHMPPFDAQRITTALITTHRRSFVFNGLGTGKTRSALFAYDFLKKTNADMQSGLIVAPLATLRQTWAREIELIFPHLSYRVLHGTKAKRIAALEEDVNLYIINHDGVETILPELLANKHKLSYAVLDELSMYKNAKTNLFKKTYTLISEIDRVCGMTATPMPTSSTDAYGQIKMLLPALLKGKSFTRFREELQIKVNEFRWVDKRDSVEGLFKLMQPAVRFSRDECYDLPPCQTVVWNAGLSKDQQRAFQQMGDECAVPSLNVMAVNAADQLNKLRQIAGGVVYDRDHNEHVFDITDRVKLLEDAVEQSASKVIVFTPYKHSLNQLVDQLRKRWTVEYVSGSVTPTRREQIFTSFMHCPDPHILVAHPDCMSHGLTLTEASTIVWWGPPDSLETFEQANGRITRAGQRHSQLIVCLCSTKLEEQIFKLLERRANVQQALLDLFERQDKGDLS